MTKEQVLKKAYGRYYDIFEPYILENGELALSNIDSEAWGFVDELDFVSIGNGFSNLRILIVINALYKIIEMNRQHANDQYGDSERAEAWACVRVARESINNALK